MNKVVSGLDNPRFPVVCRRRCRPVLLLPLATSTSALLRGRQVKFPLVSSSPSSLPASGSVGSARLSTPLETLRHLHVPQASLALADYYCRRYRTPPSKVAPDAERGHRPSKTGNWWLTASLISHCGTSSNHEAPPHLPGPWSVISPWDEELTLTSRDLR